MAVVHLFLVPGGLIRDGDDPYRKSGGWARGIPYHMHVFGGECSASEINRINADCPGEGRAGHHRLELPKREQNIQRQPAQRIRRIQLLSDRYETHPIVSE